MNSLSGGGVLVGDLANNNTSNHSKSDRHKERQEACHFEHAEIHERIEPTTLVALNNTESSTSSAPTTTAGSKSSLCFDKEDDEMTRLKKLSSSPLRNNGVEVRQQQVGDDAVTILGAQRRSGASSRRILPTRMEDSLETDSLHLAKEKSRLRTNRGGLRTTSERAEKQQHLNTSSHHTTSTNGSFYDFEEEEDYFVPLSP